MPANIIPVKFDEVTGLGRKCLRGAQEIGPSIPLVLNTPELISANLSQLIATQAAYKQNFAAIRELYEEYHAVLDECYAWCKRTRDYLKQYLGDRFNQSWTQAGFHNSIAVDKSYAFLSALLSSLAALFDEQSGWQDEAHGITAEQAQSLLTGLSNAATVVTQGRLASGLTREPRDAALSAMRGRLRGLCNELKQQIGLYDQRWLAFGLSIPGASSTPAVPQNVTAISYGAGQILVSCDASPGATNYRFFTQRIVLDEEPVFAGSSTVPNLVIADLTPDQLYEVFVSATNEAGESDLSEPAEVTPIALAKAA